MRFDNTRDSLHPGSLTSTASRQISRHYPSSHFDDHLDELMDICEQLIQHNGVFHLTIHFSSSQLVCWTFDNPYTFQVYNADEVFSENFLRLFAPLDSKLHTCIARNQVKPLLQSLKGLRQKTAGSELRNASIHMMNGFIALSYACDDTRYINFKNLTGPLMQNCA